MIITKNYCPERLMTVFFERCKNLNYTNNISKDSIKYDWVINENQGQFFYTFNTKKQKLIAMSGCHTFKDGMRLVFRAAQLPNEDSFKGLSKYHFNSIPWREHIPLQINWGKSLDIHNFYITTHTLTERHIGKTDKTAKSLLLLANYGIVSYLRTELIYNTYQTVWKLNEQKYQDSKNGKILSAI